jgi:hypothetical protein
VAKLIGSSSVTNHLPKTLQKASLYKVVDEISDTPIHSNVPSEQAVVSFVNDKIIEIEESTQKSLSEFTEILYTEEEGLTSTTPLAKYNKLFNSTVWLSGGTSGYTWIYEIKNKSKIRVVPRASGRISIVAIVSSVPAVEEIEDGITPVNLIDDM